jgi:hypothetical protein
MTIVRQFVIHLLIHNNCYVTMKMIEAKAQTHFFTVLSSQVLILGLLRMYHERLDQWCQSGFLNFGLRGRRRTYLTILKLADHALIIYGPSVPLVRGQ